MAFKSSAEDYLLFSLLYAVNGANFNTLGTTINILTLVAGVGVNDVDVALFDRISRAFGDAQSAGGAFIGDRHSHSNNLQKI